MKECDFNTQVLRVLIKECDLMGYSETTLSVSCCSYEALDVCTGYEPAPCCERHCVSSTNSMYCIGVDLATIV